MYLPQLLLLRLLARVPRLQKQLLRVLQAAGMREQGGACPCVCCSGVGGVKCHASSPLLVHGETPRARVSRGPSLGTAHCYCVSGTGHQTGNEGQPRLCGLGDRLAHTHKVRPHRRGSGCPVPGRGQHTRAATSSQTPLPSGNAVLKNNKQRVLAPRRGGQRHWGGAPSS